MKKLYVWHVFVLRRETEAECVCERESESEAECVCERESESEAECV